MQSKCIHNEGYERQTATGEQQVYVRKISKIEHFRSLLLHLVFLIRSLSQSLPRITRTLFLYFDFVGTCDSEPCSSYTYVLTCYVRLERRTCSFKGMTSIAILKNEAIHSDRKQLTAEETSYDICKSSSTQSSLREKQLITERDGEKTLNANQMTRYTCCFISLALPWICVCVDFMPRVAADFFSCIIKTE